MAHVFKPTYTKPIPPDAKIIANRKGQRLARFKHDGKTIEAPPDQRRLTVSYRDRGMVCSLQGPERQVEGG